MKSIYTALLVLIAVHASAQFNNLLLGTPNNPYSGPSQYGTIEFPRGEILFSNTNTQNQLYLVQNAYMGSSGSFMYRTTSVASSVGLDNGSIFFFTAGSAAAGTAMTLQNRMMITNNGKVGIGTSNPQANLEVFNADVLGTSAGDKQLITRIGSNAGASNNVYNNTWITRSPGGGNSWNTVKFHDGLSVDASFVNPGFDTKTWWERDPYNNIQSWGTAGTQYMTINAGHIGIGTPTPYGGMLQINAESNGNNALRLEAGAFSMNGSSVFQIDKVGAVGGRFVVNSDGNVGIGTSAPDAKLAVNGQIHATEVKVTATVPGPDYVFEKDYALPSLESVKTYIDQNKHLPEVPSAKEMEANGINVGEMNMLLLKKVEELTLYVIEQKEQLRVQQQQLNLQNKEIKELKSKVK